MYKRLIYKKCLNALNKEKCFAAIPHIKHACSNSGEENLRLTGRNLQQSLRRQSRLIKESWSRTTFLRQSIILNQNRTGVWLILGLNVCVWGGHNIANSPERTITTVKHGGGIIMLSGYFSSWKFITVYWKMGWSLMQDLQNDRGHSQSGLTLLELLDKNKLANISVSGCSKLVERQI
ncbi:hypothetical protein XENOCAPTIV_020929 [Xenoophorus captivus]|uniref:Uncharacterized protein n=1 Tax=Xenoophorus captivus TaxID=1517983 RepID=A0ABV0QU94_9TELE